MATKVHIFVPCFIDQLYPQTAVNMVKVLRKLDCKVEYNPAQTCCGQPAFNAGFFEEAAEVGAKFVQDMQAAELIVCPSASCVGFVRQHLGGILATEAQKQAYARIKDRLVEFSDFLFNGLKRYDTGAELQAKVVYHDACSALRECQIKEAPRALLRRVKGLELIESPDAEVCCGFGGSFAAKFEPISTAMADEKVQNAQALGAQYIVSTDMSCLLQLQTYIQAQNIPLQTLHLADVLARF